MSDQEESITSDCYNVHLTSAHWSTNAITSLAQFITKNENNVTSVNIPVSELGSDVEGIKPLQWCLMLLKMRFSLRRRLTDVTS